MPTSPGHENIRSQNPGACAGGDASNAHSLERSAPSSTQTASPRPASSRAFDQTAGAVVSGAPSSGPAVLGELRSGNNIQSGGAGGETERAAVWTIRPAGGGLIGPAASSLGASSASRGGIEPSNGNPSQSFRPSSGVDLGSAGRDPRRALRAEPAGRHSPRQRSRSPRHHGGSWSPRRGNVETRGPWQGRVERPRGVRIGSRTKRGPRQTANQRRYLANQPQGTHPRLKSWDLLPAGTRSSLAGQERSIFRSSGFLVSRFDFMLYHTMRNYNADSLPLAFPSAPEWWPTHWGHLPVTLPWEFSLKRGQLVRAKGDSAVWKEAYQLFL